MSYSINPLIESVVEPPIGEAQAWIADREFPADRPLIDLSQAVPSYPPATALTDHLGELLCHADCVSVIDRDHWGRSELARVCLRHAVEIAETVRPARTYWLLLSSACKTYWFLPVFVREFYPAYDRLTPHEIVELRVP